jgi:uncharacterized protein
MPRVERPTSTLVEQLVAERIAGLGLESHATTIDAAAGAMLELGLSDERLAQWQQERDMDETPTISSELLEILACPVCKTAVRLEDDELICDSCGRHYQIEDGIPIMLVDEEE